MASSPVRAATRAPANTSRATFESWLDGSAAPQDALASASRRSHAGPEVGRASSSARDTSSSVPGMAGLGNGDALGDAGADGNAGGDSLGVGAGVSVGSGDSLGDGEADSEGEGIGVGGSVGAGVGVGVGVGCG